MLSEVKSTIKRHTNGNGNKDHHSLSKRQLGTIAIVTFGLTLFGLYYYNSYYKIMKKNKKNNEKQKTGLNDHDVDRLFEAPANDNEAINNINNKQQTRKYENNNNENENENEEKDYTLEWRDIKDKILSIFEEFTENGINKKDIKILIMDNKLSKLPIHLYNEGFQDVTVCDLSNSSINQMKNQYGQQYSNIKWLNYSEDDIKNNRLQQTLTDNFHLIIHKDVSEAFIGKEEEITMETNEFLHEKLKYFSKMLIEQIIKDENNEETAVVGKYLLMTPRRKIPHLKDEELNWNTRRIIAIGFDVSAVQYSKTPFLYFHICTKMNRDNAKEFLKKRREERQNAIQQNVYLANENDMLITDIEVNKTENNKTIITIVNTDIAENMNDKEKDKNEMDFSIKNDELIQTKSVHIRHLDMTFLPTIIVDSIEKDILIRYSKFENSNSIQTGILFDKVPYYFMIQGTIVSMRKFGKRIIFYDVKLSNNNNNNNDNNNNTDDEDSATTIQCIAQKSYVNSLSNEKLNKEFKTNYMTQVNDEVQVVGVLGLSDKRILSIFCQYVSLVQQ